MILVILTLMYPVQASNAAWWYLHHMPAIISVLLIVDMFFWYRVYKRYRRTHPYQPVTLK
jgi:hypothetical protein